jgi:hypothetical protein
MSLFSGRLPGNKSLFSGSLPGYIRAHFPEVFREIGAYFPEAKGGAEATKQEFLSIALSKVLAGHSLYSGAVFTDTLPVSCWAQLAV